MADIEILINVVKKNDFKKDISMTGKIQDYWNRNAVYSDNLAKTRVYGQSNQVTPTYSFETLEEK